MALLTKPNMQQVWASGGDIVEPSDLKKQQGWTVEVPPHQFENWIQNRQDEYLAHINQRGIPEWDGNTEYEAASLSYVQGSNGVVYKSVAASGPATTVQDPTTDVTDTYWAVAFASTTQATETVQGIVELATQAEAEAGVDDERAMTALKVKQAITAFSGASEEGISGSSSNLKASATGTNATVTVTADSICLKNASNEQIVLNALALAINSATAGANGLDTGVLAASTWYHVWVIWNGATTAGLLSLSPTSPTLPVGYTHKARIGEIRTDATANKYPLSYYQYGDLIQINKAAGTNVPAMLSAASGSTGGVMAPLGLSSFIPPTAISARISAYSSNEAGCQIGIAPSAVYGLYEFSGGSGPTTPGVYAVSLLTEVPLIPGAMTIGIQSNTAGARFYVNGWRTQL